MFKALVITPNDRTSEVGTLLAIARAEARRREHAELNPLIRALLYAAEVGVYVAVYEVSESSLKSVRQKK